MNPLVIPLQDLRMHDVDRVGGKNASLGELMAKLAAAGVRVPGGFATTADAFREFLAQPGPDGQALADRIAAELATLDVADVERLAVVGARIRGWVVAAAFPAALEAAVRAALDGLAASEGPAASYAVRSSATAEDLPEASFAGQQETFLNIAGHDAILHAIKEVFASLYNDRAIAYRVHQGYDHAGVALSAGVQRMVRSDLGCAGVVFTLDTESGFRDTVFVTASLGLGETVVQGAVNPDEFHVHKPMLARGRPAIVRRALGSKALKMVFTDSREAGRSVRTEAVAEADRHRFCLSDEQVLELARHAVAIESHYGRPMDIEWGLDGSDGQIYILQARPETVKSRHAPGQHETFRLLEQGELLASGRAIGRRIGVGPVRIVASAAEMARVRPGDVLVTDMTDPNWEPVMKRAAAIVTNRGGRTCHAAIIARELGVPAIVGCGDATEALREGETVTVCCAEGDTGRVYRGHLAHETRAEAVGDLPALPVKLMMNVGNPDLAFELAQRPGAGVGLARIEFVINNVIGVHPKAILEPQRLDAPQRDEIARRARGYASPRAFFVAKLAEGIATLAAAFWPRPVIVRLSDFKSNEYRKLLGGELFEPAEENPMLGLRGAARYLAPDFAACFALECEALRRARETMGLSNVELMVPFVRTPAEARAVVGLLARQGLVRGRDGLRLVMMCELPSNALLAEQFLEHFDGFSIGSNDLTQLTLGLDRDSGLVAGSFDERDPAVRMLIARAIAACKAQGKYVGICGQGPSDHPDIAHWLVAQGIGSISLNPDTLLPTWRGLAANAAPLAEAA